MHCGWYSYSPLVFTSWLPDASSAVWSLIVMIDGLIFRKQKLISLLLVVSFPTQEIFMVLVFCRLYLDLWISADPFVPAVGTRRCRLKPDSSRVERHQQWAEKQRLRLINQGQSRSKGKGFTGKDIRSFEVLNRTKNKTFSSSDSTVKDFIWLKIIPY